MWQIKKKTKCSRHCKYGITLKCKILTQQKPYLFLCCKRCILVIFNFLLDFDTMLLQVYAIFYKCYRFFKSHFWISICSFIISFEILQCLITWFHFQEKNVKFHYIFFYFVETSRKIMVSPNVTLFDVTCTCR